MVSLAASSKSCLVGLMHRTIMSPLRPDWFMLLASTTWSLKLSINSSGTWLCDVRRQESATSVCGGMVVLLIICTRLAISHLNRSVHTSSRSPIVTTGRAKFILQLCLAKNSLPRMASLFIWHTTKISSNFTSLNSNRYLHYSIEWESSVVCHLSMGVAFHSLVLDVLW